MITKIKLLLRIIFLEKSLPSRWRRKLRKIYLFFKFNIVWFLLKDRKIRNINCFERIIYSQNGEDGILKIIFYKIGITNKFFVEFGVQDGKECNTRYLHENNGWEGIQIDSGDHKSLFIKKEFITAENINTIFNKYGVPKYFDLLSIDIDSNDYWVWKALKNFEPNVVVIEYNANIPTNESKVIKYDPHFKWDGTNYFGASLLALSKLAKSKGYTLVGCDNNGVNAFFVKDNLIKEHFEIKNIKELYKIPRYGRKINGNYGLPMSNKFKLMVNV